MISFQLPRNSTQIAICCFIQSIVNFILIKQIYPAMKNKNSLFLSMSEIISFDYLFICNRDR